MEQTLPRLSTLSLDPKRIAATSVAIALHVLVLMLLMLPTQMAPPKPVVDNVMEIVPLPIKVKPILPVVPLPQTRPTQTQQPQRVEPQVPVDTTPSVNDVYVPPTPPDVVINSFDPPSQPVFVQITTDRAPSPPYPMQALKRRISGVVTLKVHVDARGRPVDISIDSSSGSKLLDDAALKFVLARWHFVPAMQDGVPIEAYALVPIDFVLDR